MEYAVVTVEYAQRKRRDLALPINVPSQVLAGAVARALEQTFPGKYSLAVRNEEAVRRLPPSTSLNDAGILCGAFLLLQTTEQDAPMRQPGAYFQTENGDVLPLIAAQISVGRSDLTHGIFADVDLAPYDLRKYTSRRHASIERREDDYLLRDAGSTHGTFINGKRIGSGQSQPLQNGDAIEFGLASKDGVRVTFHAHKD